MNTENKVKILNNKNMDEVIGGYILKHEWIYKGYEYKETKDNYLKVNINFVPHIAKADEYFDATTGEKITKKEAHEKMWDFVKADVEKKIYENEYGPLAVE